jgi:hypothetical protein
MDDFNMHMLSEAKNEYSSRLISILSPHILDGFLSIFKEGVTLCDQNDEQTKYLMTFQNFLTRVPKWNQEIINDETSRIINISKCLYLNDLLTCVHITQLKILTSIRVSSKQKKITIDIPKLNNYIHKVYIFAARKFYKAVYLFEQNVSPLQQQKHLRECSVIIDDAIMNVIRENIPIEQILRAYMDDTVEEEVTEEIIDIPNSWTAPASTPITTNEESLITTNKMKIQPDDPPISPPPSNTNGPKTFTIKRCPATLTDTAGKEPTPAVVNDPVVNDPVVNDPVVNEPVVKDPVVNDPVVNDPEPNQPQSSSQSLPQTKPSLISFNNVDNQLNYSPQDTTNTLSPIKGIPIDAPKHIDRLETISTQRHNERKLSNDTNDGEDVADDDEYERLTIHTDASVNLNSLDIDDLSSSKTDVPKLSGVEILN